MLVTVPRIFLPSGIFGADAFPRIALELLHAERDAVGFLVDADDLHLDRLADVEDLGRMVDAAPGHVGDVQQAVDAAEVDERTVVGDVLDDALDHLALFEVLDDLGALLGAALLEHGAARHDDVAAAAIHLEDLERLRIVHQRGDVADRPDVDLAARQEGHGAVEIDGEAALDLVEDDAFDALALVEFLFEPDPALFAARLLARQHGLAKRVLDALDIDLDRIADLQLAVLGLGAEFLHRHAAFDLEADVDDGHILFDGRDDALDDLTFARMTVGKGFFEQARRNRRGMGFACDIESPGSPASRGRRRGLALRLPSGIPGFERPLPHKAASAHGMLAGWFMARYGIFRRWPQTARVEDPASGLVSRAKNAVYDRSAARNAASIDISDVSSKCASAAGAAASWRGPCRARPGARCRPGCRPVRPSRRGIRCRSGAVPRAPRRWP